MARPRGFSRAGRILTAGATGLLFASLGLGSLGPVHVSANAVDSQVNVNVILMAKASNSAPTTLIVKQVSHGPKVAVSVGASTSVLRRFYGNSSLHELSVGDHLLISGGWGSGHRSFEAVGLIDNSIQVGHSQINGKVTYVGGGLHRIAVQVTANEGKDAAFGLGATVTLDVSPTTKVELLNHHAGTAGSLRPGMALTLWGLSNRDAHLVLSPHDISQILVNGDGKLTKAAPADSTPA